MALCAREIANELCGQIAEARGQVTALEEQISSINEVAAELECRLVTAQAEKQVMDLDADCVSTEHILTLFKRNEEQMTQMHQTKTQIEAQLFLNLM